MGFLHVAGVRIGNYLGGDQLRVQAFEDRNIHAIMQDHLGGEAVAAAQSGEVGRGPGSGSGRRWLPLI